MQNSQNEPDVGIDRYVRLAVEIQKLRRALRRDQAAFQRIERATGAEDPSQYDVVFIMEESRKRQRELDRLLP